MVFWRNMFPAQYFFYGEKYMVSLYKLKTTFFFIEINI